LGLKVLKAMMVQLGPKAQLEVLALKGLTERLVPKALKVQRAQILLYRVHKATQAQPDLKVRKEMMEPILRSLAHKVMTGQQVRKAQQE
jgi:hypothetical protein